MLPPSLATERGKWRGAIVWRNSTNVRDKVKCRIRLADWSIGTCSGTAVRSRVGGGGCKDIKAKLRKATANIALHRLALAVNRYVVCV